MASPGVAAEMISLQTNENGSRYLSGINRWKSRFPLKVSKPLLPTCFQHSVNLPIFCKYFPKNCYDRLYYLSCISSQSAWSTERGENIPEYVSAISSNNYAEKPSECQRRSFFTHPPTNESPLLPFSPIPITSHTTVFHVNCSKWKDNGLKFQNY